jgi:hypothetical protein
LSKLVLGEEFFVVDKDYDYRHPGFRAVVGLDAVLTVPVEVLKDGK